jgi:hypothetical protein
VSPPEISAIASQGSSTSVISASETISSAPVTELATIELSGYLTKLYVRWFGLTRVNSIVASSVTGALLMVSLGRHLAAIKAFHHQRAQHAGDHLVTEAAD